MKFSWLLSLAALASPILAEEESKDVPKTTTFNGKPVPAMLELTPENVDQKLAKGNWMVEYYSPYCGHCKEFAPTLQTFYEFYYTSKPFSTSGSSASTKGLNSFDKYYDFHFAKMDCIAYADTCDAKDVKGYPTIMLYQNGKELRKVTGGKSIQDLSKMVEEHLEAVRPGSRPKGGPILPKVGEDHVKETDMPAEQHIDKTKNSAAGAAAGKKHNEIAGSATKGAKPASTPNPEGIPVTLTAENFQKLVTATQDPWFVKFFAPWCSHCMAMAPNWAEMAKDMQGQLNIGSVNCEVERRLCKDANVKGFPTLLFFRGGERVEYNGLRGVGDLISFAKKGLDVGKGLREVDEKAFKKMEETEEVIFVYFYDHATTAEDFAALNHLTLSLIGHGKLVKSTDPKLAKRFKISTWPRLMVSRDGKPSYYPWLAPSDMRDFRKILTWMKTVWQPLVPELTAANAREIMTNAYVVLGILSRERSDEFVIAKREMKNAALEWIDRETHLRQLERQELRDAKQLRVEEAQDRNDDRALDRARGTRIVLEAKPEVKFAWVDGVFWERWIKTTYGVDVADGEKVLIADQDNHRYWDTTMTGNPIVPSRTSILETIPRVLTHPPKIAAKSTSSTLGTVFYKLRLSWRHHPWISPILFVAFIVGSIFIVRRARKRQWSASAFFEGLDGEKGVFGNSSAAKND